MKTTQPHRMHTNSLDAYQDIIATLPKSRAAVMECVVKHAPITRQDIADRLGRPINQITGRVRELLDVKVIEEHCTRKVNGKRRALLWPVPPEPEQGTLPLGEEGNL